MSTKGSILKVINAIRKSHQDTVILYTQGQCYNFAEILEAIFKDRYTISIEYSQSEGHVYTKIDSEYYDIEGHHESPPQDLLPFKYIFSRGRNSGRSWQDNENRRLCRPIGDGNFKPCKRYSKK